MNEMIERCSIALVSNYKSISPNLQKAYREDVIRIIKAMREPTDEMSFAGAEASGEDCLSIAINCYQAMIDAVLK